MTQLLIEGRGLSLTRQGTAILSNVDIHVGAGEIVTIVGPNGAGKTTLVRVLLGVLAPDGGTVTRKPGLQVGYLPQKLHVDPVLPLGVRRLVTLTKRASRAEVDAALVEVGGLHLAEKAVSGLSGGEMQRVLLARALLRRPDLLVLDEPTQGVDQTGQAEFYELLRTIRDRRGCGIVLISHDLHVVMAATDRVICLQHHVCCAGAPRTVAGDPEYRRLFGPAAAEFAIYSHRHDHGHDLHGNPLPCDHDHGHAHTHAPTASDEVRP
ncbi:metal ABC transporter ATP-binding protein [Caenispirillum bisanense]|uniref:Zinc transport system ATP-binding protein n=1 Tax=Caenispirillum bisanense TaxID=414052 RepID=A0A286GQ20_9PROT|nr:metal ABC transporter ATP-binding protein [Caenispirillum bisanense]SOD97074.1 zinc transport system ATP-binding protein [Caenispirillum bisanense]